MQRDKSIFCVSLVATNQGPPLQASSIHSPARRLPPVCTLQFEEPSTPRRKKENHNISAAVA